MVEYRSYSEPMEAFEVFLNSDARFTHLWPEDFDVWAKPDIQDAVREFQQFYTGEHMTLVLEGMEEATVGT